MSRDLVISSYKSRFDKKKKLAIRTLSWDQLKNKLSQFRITDETFDHYQKLDSLEKLAIKDVGYFVGGEFNPPLRKSFNLKSRSILTLDLDHLESWDVEEIAEVYGDVEHLCHSSHSHSAESPRLRLVFPLSRDVTLAEYEPLARMVASRMGSMDLFDDTTYQFSRIMFFPSRSADGVEFFSATDGRPWINPDEVLKEYNDFSDFGEWPESSREESRGRREHKEVASNPFEIPGVIGAFNRSYPIDEAVIEFGLPYEESGQGDNRYSYTDGSSADGAIYYADDGHMFSHHESDPASGNNNAWDLVRLHKFSNLDEDVPRGTDLVSMPSQIEMYSFAKTLADVIGEWDYSSKNVKAEDEFNDVVMSEEEDEKGNVTTKKLKTAELSFSAIMKSIALWSSAQGRLTETQVADIILRTAAAGGDIEGSQRDVIAARIKEVYPFDGVTKASVVNDIKSKSKSLRVRGGDDQNEVKDIQVEFLRNYLDKHHAGGKHLKRTGSQFWKFNGTHWIMISDEHISGGLAASIVDLRTNAKTRREERALAAAVGDNQTSNIFSSLWTMFKGMMTSDTGEGLDPLGLKRTFLPSMINCLSGEIWINAKGKRQLRPHDPLTLSTNVIPVEWNKEATCPNWDYFCASTFSKALDPKGMQRLLESLIGYACSQSREHRLFVNAVGGTASGKSTFGSLLDALLGDTCHNMTLRNYDGSNSHATTGLIGRKVLKEDDYPEGLMLPDGFVKQASEEKVMAANPKGRDEISFVNRAILMIFSNSPITTRETTGALYDRALIIPFNNTLARENRDPRRMRRMITDELEGVFTRCVDAYCELTERGDWEFPVDCTRAWEMWQTQSNPFPLFLSECIQKEEGGFIERQRLFHLYNTFIEEESPLQGRNASLKRNTFYRKVEETLGPFINKSGVRGWRGVSIVAGCVRDGGYSAEDEFNDEDTSNVLPGECAVLKDAPAFDATQNFLNAPEDSVIESNEWDC